MMSNEPKTVLIIDDDAAIRLLAKYHFESLGFKTVDTDSGIEALKLIETSKIDMILTDLMMPIMNGFDLIKEVRSLEISIPIVLFTAAGSGIESRNRIKALEVGANAFISKPFSSNDLKQLIDEHLT